MVRIRCALWHRRVRTVSSHETELGGAGARATETPAGAGPSPDHVEEQGEGKALEAVGLTTPEAPETPEEDVDPDDRETEDPGAYWKAVRTKGRLDLDVGSGLLKPREGAFVIEYTLTPDDARGAAIRAGYAASSAHVQAGRLMNRERVQVAIAREFASKAAATGVDRGYLVRQCRDIAEDASCKVSDRLRAIELMGKLLGEFAPEKVEHNHQGLRWSEIAAAGAEDAQVIEMPALSPPDEGDNPV
jgi:hypothetical protein